MEVIRYLKDQKWLPLYIKELKNRLRKDKNLADLPDRNEAIKNLGLTGDVTSHSHDDRYPTKDLVNTMLEKVNQKVENAILDVKITNSGVDSKIFELRDSVIEKKLDAKMIHVGSLPPSNPEANTIWFCTVPDNTCIKVYYQGEWIIFGSIWQ